MTQDITIKKREKVLDFNPSILSLQKNYKETHKRVPAFKLSRPEFFCFFLKIPKVKINKTNKK